MASSQSTNFFGDETDGFEDELREIKLGSRSNSAILPLKRKHDDIEEEEEHEKDVDTHAMSTMRQKDDPENVYGASSFGGWGQYMQRKRAKLQIQNQDMTSVISGIFKGIEIYINGHTEPSVQTLRELIVAHGGIFHAYLTKKGLVTHIVAMNLTPAKVKEFQRMKVVRPEWILDSIKAGKLLPWIQYKLVMENRIDAAQGTSVTQTTLSTYTQHSTPTLLKRVDQNPTVIKDPLYTTDPTTFEQAARIPSYAVNKSNQAAQRLMARPGWQEEHTAVSGSKFIDGYYQNSRLHHLSMWKAELKDLVAKARERFEQGDDQPLLGDNESTTPMGHGVSMMGAELIKSWEAASPTKKGKETATPSIVERIYMHCDFDCFFVSAGLIDRPELRGKPVVVCHSQGVGEGAASTSEIASSSYEARSSGIRNGMSLGQARQLCPEVITLPYEFEKYKELSLKFYTVLLSYSEEIQPVSVDEALLDVSRVVANLKYQALADDPSAKEMDYAVKLAEMIRTRMLEVTKCQVSIGIGENLLLARIASRKAKPASTYHLLAIDAPAFLAPLPLDMIWGVGYANKRKAEEKLGVFTIGDLQSQSKSLLIKTFGPSMGEKLFKAAKGQDDTKLQPDQKRKSVSAEINFGIRFRTNEHAEEFMRKLGAEVSSRLKAISTKGRHLTLKIMKRHPEAPIEAPKFMGHGICETFSKSTSISDLSGGATDDADVIGQAAWRLLESFHFDPTELRGLGLQVTKLEGKDGVPIDDDKRDPGQQRLEFRRSPTRPRLASNAAGELERDAPMLDYQDLNSIDEGVLESLPDDIRQEIIQQMTKSGAQTTVTEPVPTEDMVSEIQEIAVDIIPKSPVPKAPLTDASHITRQLRPKHKTVVSPEKQQLFARQKDAFQPTDEELAKLGLDPDVFFALPPELQKEQIIYERNQRRQQISEAPKFHGGAGKTPLSIAAGALTRSPSGRPISKRGDFNIKVSYPEKVSLAVKTGNGISTLTEVGDIQAYVKRWVVSHQKKNLKPVTIDVEGLKSWLVRCMEMRDTDSGMEKAVVILKWWRELLRRSWASEESYAIPLPGAQCTPQKAEESVAEAWWRAFAESRRAVDAIFDKRFGGKLSLK
ncbi:DNA repair protein REV1; AltName: Full=Rev1-like terminal deoxycytidyl transferase [Serendipita indica DSM 11827]|nr:DNA repair protein REV1; AltName: Full=Rev1-like terminal deoxycytidyl transferase [Serendipita indica DSM 11827]